MADIILETQRMILRTQAPGDELFWAAHMNNPDVLRYLGAAPLEPHQIEAKFARNAAQMAKEGFGFWMMQLKEVGILLGHAGLSRIAVEAAPPALQNALQIGWSLRSDYWRRGLAIEAARAILDYAFARFDVPYIYAQTSNSNIPSWRMMDKLGMARRVDLDYHDSSYPDADNPTIIYETSQQDWCQGESRLTGGQN